MATSDQPFPSNPTVVGNRHATRTTTENSVVRTWPRVIPEDNRTRSGVFICQTGAHTILAAAHAATAGFWWLINPVGSTVLVAFRRCEFMSQMGSGLSTPTSPRIQLERLTFTGTASGAQVTPSKALTADASNTATLRTATTGLTPAAGAGLFAFLPWSSASATGFGPASVSDWNPDNTGMPVLAAGEGIVLRQADAGTTSDTRRFVTSIAWEEYVSF